jgi:peptidoglycan/xylan/chitin deacetylase (PgdA/CDA1 family)
VAARAAVILMYHGLRRRGEAPDPDPRVERYVVSWEAFERQMRWLREAGLASVGLRAFLAGRAPAPGTHGPGRTIGLTFDDGRQSDHRLALPILQRMGLHATFFVVTDWIDRPGFLSRAEIRELAAAGMEIGSHTASHRFLSELPEPEVRGELAASRAVLQDLTGRPVPFLSLPGGRGSRQAFRIAREVGYRAVCTSRVGTNRLGGGAFCLRRLPVTGRTSPARLQDFVEGDPWVLTATRALSGARRAIRGTIGRWAYEWIQARLLAHHRRAGVR